MMAAALVHVEPGAFDAFGCQSNINNNNSNKKRLIGGHGILVTAVLGAGRDPYFTGTLNLHHTIHDICYTCND
jgi:hypothetical protein